MKLKRDARGRFVKGTIPPLKALGKMPLWWKLKDSAGKKKFYIEHPEARREISLDKKRYFGKKENREKARERRIEYLKKHPYFGVIQRESALMFGKEHPEIVKRNAAAGREYWKIKRRRIERSRYLKRLWKNPEMRKKQSRIKKGYYKNHPEARLLASLKSKNFFKNPENRRLIARLAHGRYKNHPYLKERMSRQKQIYYENNPLALRRLLGYGRKSGKRHLRTKQGWMVMSEGEKKIADFLFEKRIKAEYEGVELNLPEMDPIPDFYIPSFNLFVEFYGGHPKAWKTKVEKNRLYSKYKIPVIFITPAELSDLGYFLLKDAERISKSPLAKNFDVDKWRLGRKGKARIGGER